MPTTSRGYRYPASSATPNVPQDIQNLAADINADLASDWVTSVNSGASGIQAVTGSTYTTLPGFTGSSGVAVPTSKSLQVEFACPIGSVTNGFVFLQLLIGSTPSVAFGASNQWYRPYLIFQIQGTGSVMSYALQGYVTGSGVAADVRGTGGTIRMRHKIV